MIGTNRMMMVAAGCFVLLLLLGSVTWANHLMGIEFALGTLGITFAGLARLFWVQKREKIVAAPAAAALLCLALMVVCYIIASSPGQGYWHGSAAFEWGLFVSTVAAVSACIVGNQVLLYVASQTKPVTEDGTQTTPPPPEVPPSSTPPLHSPFPGGIPGDAPSTELPHNQSPSHSPSTPSPPSGGGESLQTPQQSANPEEVRRIIEEELRKQAGIDDALLEIAKKMIKKLSDAETASVAQDEVEALASAADRSAEAFRQEASRITGVGVPDNTDQRKIIKLSTFLKAIAQFILLCKQAQRTQQQSSGSTPPPPPEKNFAWRDADLDNIVADDQTRGVVDRIKSITKNSTDIFFAVNNADKVFIYCNNKQKEWDKNNFKTLMSNKLPSVAQSQKAVFAVSGDSGSGKTTNVFNLLEVINLSNINKVIIGLSFLNYFGNAKTPKNDDSSRYSLGVFIDKPNNKVYIEAFMFEIFRNVHQMNASLHFARLKDTFQNVNTTVNEIMKLYGERFVVFSIKKNDITDFYNELFQASPALVLPEVIKNPTTNMDINKVKDYYNFFYKLVHKLNYIFGHTIPNINTEIINATQKIKNDANIILLDIPGFEIMYKDYKTPYTCIYINGLNEGVIDCSIEANSSQPGTHVQTKGFKDSNDAIDVINEAAANTDRFQVKQFKIDHTNGLTVFYTPKVDEASPPNEMLIQKVIPMLTQSYNSEMALLRELLVTKKNDYNFTFIKCLKCYHNEASLPVEPQAIPRSAPGVQPVPGLRQKWTEYDKAMKEYDKFDHTLWTDTIDTQAQMLFLKELITLGNQHFIKFIDSVTEDDKNRLLKRLNHRGRGLVHINASGRIISKMPFAQLQNTLRRPQA